MPLRSIAGAEVSPAWLARPPDASRSDEKELRNAVADSRVADRILSSRAWQNTANHQAIIDVAKATGADGDKSLAALCDDPQRLARTDDQGKTLLTHLQTLSTQTLQRKIVKDGGGDVTRAALVDSALADVLDANSHVTQNGANSCASTSMQIALARDDPAEYARLLVGLSGEQGEVVMRGGGKLGLQRESFDDGQIVGKQNRTPSEVIFQGAAIEFANGGRLGYDARDDRYEIRIPGPDIPTPVTGLSSNMQTSLLQNLFGHQYGTVFGDANLMTFGLDPMGAHEGQAAHDYLAGYRGSLPVELTYRFVDASGLDAFTELHSVLFDHVDSSNGRVYFQNPWGDHSAGDYSAGHVDASQPDLFYLKHDEFVSNVVWVVGPTEGAYRPPPPTVVHVPTGTTTTTTTTTTTAPTVQPETHASAPKRLEAEGPPTGTSMAPTTTVP
jgi:hypothetical protein